MALVKCSECKYFAKEINECYLGDQSESELNFKMHPELHDLHNESFITGYNKFMPEIITIMIDWHDNDVLHECKIFKPRGNKE